MSDAALQITIDGATHLLRVADLGPRDALALRQATGMSLRRLLELAESDPDIDVVAAAVWLARRHNGEPNLSFEDAIEGLSYLSAVAAGVVADEAEQDVDDPEA